MPSVSICIPNYNQGRYLGQAVESALAQTHADVEVIVSDNASTDETAAVMNRFSDPRLRVVRNPRNIGMVANFNQVIRLANAPLVKFLCADDVLEPECVARMVSVAERFPAVGLVSVGRLLIDEEGRVIASRAKSGSEVVRGHDVLARVHRAGNEIGNPSQVMVHRKVLDVVGGFDPDYGAYMNDWDLWLRCAEIRDVGFVGEPLVRVRLHQVQMGVIGARANADMDVNYLFVRKRWGDARPLSRRHWQKTAILMQFAEHDLWRGLYRLMFGGHEGVSRLDTFTRLARHLGPVGCGLAILYFVARLPLQARRKIANRINRRRPPLSRR